MLRDRVVWESSTGESPRPEADVPNSGLGFRLQALGFRVWALGFRV